MTKVAVVFHSGYGHTANLAEAVFSGVASVAGINAEKIAISVEGEISAADWESLDRADAIVFGSPTYMGSVSWQFKKFADTSSKAWFSQKWRNKLAAGFTNSASMNGDKHSTLQYLTTYAMQQGMLWVGTGMMPANQKSSQRNDINYLGAFAGLMAQSPADASAEEGPPPGDLETARRFGARVSEAALRWTGRQVD